MFNLRFLDEIGKLINVAIDSVNSFSSSCKDNICDHVDGCKNAIINHLTWVKDTLVSHMDLRFGGTNTHVTNEANSIRANMSAGLSPCVKSVQRGVFSGVGLPFTITLATINTHKSIVLINGRANDSDLHKVAVSSNNIIINYGHGYNYPEANASGDWEVVEYY